MDIVERLRSYRPPYGWPEEYSIIVEPTLNHVAADKIENLTYQLAEAKAANERLQKNFTHAATIAKTAWLTESCGTIGDAEYGSELCQIISDKISALQQKETE